MASTNKLNVVKTSIPSDRLSATGRGADRKGVNATITTTSLALNRSEARGPGSGSMGVGRPRPVSKSPGE
jgi:hypothetical protein